jgi:hypothetical protein
MWNNDDNNLLTETDPIFWANIIEGFLDKYSTEEQQEAMKYEFLLAQTIEEFARKRIYNKTDTIDENEQQLNIFITKVTEKLKSDAKALKIKAGITVICCCNS